MPRKPKAYKPPKEFIRQAAPESVEDQIVKAAIKWELAIRRAKDSTDFPSGPRLAGRRRAVKMAVSELRKKIGLLVPY